MGLGDEILAAGQAKLIWQETGKKVAIGSGSRTTQNDLYKFIPYLTSPKFKEPFTWLLDGCGYRDYILRKEYPNKEDKREKVLIFNDKYKAEPAIIELEPIPNDYIIIEPKIKPGAPPGKQWHHYQDVVDAFPDDKFLQFNFPTLDGVDVQKANVIQAAQWIAGCRCYIGTEGFLHHLAAAFDKPAVVLFGGYAPPEILGYDSHTNISYKAPAELGNRKARGAMDHIPPETVIKALRNYCG